MFIRAKSVTKAVVGRFAASLKPHRVHRCRDPVAAALWAAVERGILPGGKATEFLQCARLLAVPRAETGRRDAALYGTRDARRYSL